MGKILICVQVCVYMAFAVTAVNTAPAAVPGKTNEWTCPGPLGYYVDIGCMPVYKRETDYCPTRFDCDNVRRRPKNKCYINGHEYKASEFLRKEDANVCESMCFCRKGNGTNQVAAFDCIDINCPDLNAKEGCYLRRDPGCCSKVEEICHIKIQDRPTCRVDRATYFDGEYFDVEREPELSCICQPGYKGKNIPPFCIKSNHSACHHPAFSHIDYFRRNCSPIYFNEEQSRHRCFMSFRCQDTNDIIIRNSTLKEVSDKNMCLFGNIKIRVGDRLLPSDIYNCINCVCEVPPVLSCEYMSDEAC